MDFGTVPIGGYSTPFYYISFVLVIQEILNFMVIILIGQNLVLVLVQMDI